MNSEVKAKWLEALRSDKYQQGKEALCKIGYDGEKRYCCLGVLTDLYMQEFPDKIKFDIVYNRLKFIDNSDVCQIQSHDYLLPAIMHWAELDSTDPEIVETGTCLSTINDNDTSFSEIANMIETNL